MLTTRAAQKNICTSHNKKYDECVTTVVTQIVTVLM